MRATKPDGIAAPEAGVRQHIQPNTLPCSDRPAPLVGAHVLFGPHPKAGTLLLRGISDSLGRIRFDQLGFSRPPKQTAHRVKEMARLMRRFGPALAAGDNGRARDPAARL